MTLVLFDCDGTIVDSQATIVRAMTEAFAAVDRPAPVRHRILSIVGLSLPRAVSVLAPDATEDQCVALADLYRAAAQKIRLETAEDPLYDGADEAIRRLGRIDDLALGIATGKSMRGVRRLLAHYRWQDHFSTLQTADDNPSKPHPGMVERAIAETGTEPDLTVMIGDTTFDMEMARAARVRPIGVTWGYHDADLLRRAGAEVIVESYAELLSVLARLLPHAAIES